jgi:hypothetical protein
VQIPIQEHKKYERMRQHDSSKTQQFYSDKHDSKVNETSDEEFEKMIIRMIDKLKRT